MDQCKAKKSKEYDEVFDPLKAAVVQKAREKHEWEQKAEDSLVGRQGHTHTHTHTHIHTLFDLGICVNQTLVALLNVLN